MANQTSVNVTGEERSAILMSLKYRMNFLFDFIKDITDEDVKCIFESELKAVESSYTKIINQRAGG